MIPGQSPISNANCHRCHRKITDRTRRFFCTACVPSYGAPDLSQYRATSDPEIADYEDLGKLYYKLPDAYEDLDRTEGWLDGQEKEEAGGGQK